MTKRCTYCNEIKDKSEFRKNKYNSDGLRDKYKICNEMLTLRKKKLNNIPIKIKKEKTNMEIIITQEFDPIRKELLELKYQINNDRAMKSFGTNQLVFNVKELAKLGIIRYEIFNPMKV